MPRVSAVVVSYNARDYLRRTLQALQRQQDVELEIVVVDNASSDGSAEMTEKEFPNVRLIASPGNLGLAGGVNRGLAVAQHEFICTMNEDLELTEQALSRMCDYLQAHPPVGAVGPRLLNSDRSLQPSGRDLPSARTIISERYGLWRLTGRHPYGDPGRDFTQIRSVGTVPGCCIMVRRAVVDGVGGYDEANFFVNWEDIDWCHRIQASGWEVHFLGDVEAVHHWGVSTLANSLGVSLSGRSGALRYVRKRQGFLAAIGLAVALVPGDLVGVAKWGVISAFRPGARPLARRAAAVLRATVSGRALRLRAESR